MKCNRTSFVLLFTGLLFFLLGNTAMASKSDNISIALTSFDTLHCNACEGTIYFDYINSTISPLFTTQYFLTDTNNVIQHVSPIESFNNVVAGKYLLYALNFKTIDNISGNTPGNLIADIQANCSNLSVGTPITICPPTNGMKIINGKVFADTNEDGLENNGELGINGVGVFIYEDINQDGSVNGSDVLLNMDTTNIFGHYTYTIDEAILGRTITHLVVTTDTNTIALDNYYTTDNIETAVFVGNSGVISNKNFGLSQQIELENDVWLDINANSIQDPLELGIPNMSICLSNLSPLLMNGILIPPGGYRDTIFTDALGVFRFDELPDCDWQLIAHYDPTIYTPTYDADGGILNITNFTLTDGKVLPSYNNWCNQEDCLTDLDFGFRLTGEFNLSGNVCIDDGSKDGRCNTGGEEQLSSLIIALFNDKGTKLGSITTNEDGNYRFPFLPQGNYIIDFSKEQIDLDSFFLTTQLGDTPASDILIAQYSIFQKVSVLMDIIGVDFAFIAHSFTTSNIIANDNDYTICPGINYGNNLALNDFTDSDNFLYGLVKPSNKGITQIANNGIFTYTPTIFECTFDQFSYQICDLNTAICDTAIVTLFFNDEQSPSLVNIPQSLTLSCDEQIPAPGLVSAFDNCPRIGINLDETSTQGEDGCSQYDYTLTRTWTASDVCGNTNSEFQVIDIQDVVAPDIFRIYTLPNGKRLIGGIAEFTNERWKTIPFPIDFETIPLVFSQIITNEEMSPAIPQIRKVSKAQFDIHLQEEEKNDGIHNRENIAWIAIESGIEEGVTPLIADYVEIDSTLKSIDFPFSFSSVPTLFTALQTTNESDPSVIKYENLNTTSVRMQLVEEVSRDTEVAHTLEKVGYLAIEKTGDLTSKSGEIIGEIGTTMIDANWQKIILNHTYNNPIVIITSANNFEGFPLTYRVRNTFPYSFELQIQEWDYLNSTPNNTTISYLVLEGSIPLYTPDFCDSGTDGLVIGTDIIAVDNCDNTVGLAYSEHSQFDGAQLITDRKWESIDECGNEVSYTQQISCEGVAVKIQSFLQGALIGSKEEGLMRDDLRKKGLIPSKEPYTELANFQHFGAGGGEILDSNLLKTAGPNAIVDWVLLELKSANDINNIIATSSGLIQRDGDIISPSGDSLIVFTNVQFSDYYITVRHRNHIGITTKNTHLFSLNNIPQLDFRDAFTATNGNYPNIQLGKVQAQWSGDLNGDGRIIYQGPQNDPFDMFLHVILDDNNSHYLTNYITKGYTQKDFNLDGSVIFQGPNNDRSSLLFNTILAHPQNKNLNANYIISIK